MASLVVVCIYTVNNEKREFLEVDLTHENFCSNQILKTKQLALFNKESGYGTKKYEYKIPNIYVHQFKVLVADKFFSNYNFSFYKLDKVFVLLLL